ncbi:condensation domain-containing protein [Streptomyces sp. NPDC006649]|uniref:condensation domain-containing protein n=1 Tax=Streptomyces sp. NPDC006649 TaxID=3156896 RepID=UPI0033A11FC5
MTSSSPGPAAPVPLTYEQEWYLARGRGIRTRRNVRLSFRILGPLDTDRFEEAVRLFIARHDALRMALVLNDSVETPDAQQVAPVRPHDRSITTQSVTAGSADQFSRYAAAVFSRDVLTPLGGEKRPFTLRLLRHDTEHHAFLATFNNVFFDGRAHDLFSREIWRDYTTLLDPGGVPPTAAPSFARAALARHESRSVRRLERARTSWHERIEFAARNRWQEPAASPTPSGSVHVRLSASAVEELREHCKSARCTVMHWLVGSFVRAVATHTEQRRVSLWTSLDSRGPTERDTVGMFAGSAPLAINAPGAPLHEVVAEVAGAMVDALRHQQLPACDLTALLTAPPAAGTSGGPLPLVGDIYVNLRSFPGPLRSARNSSSLRITADAYPLRRITLKDSSALHLRCNEYRDGVLIDLLFDGQRAGRPLAQSIVDQIVSDTTAVTSRRLSSERFLP